MAQVVITSIGRSEERWGSTNIYDGSLSGAERTYQAEIENAIDDGFVIKAENDNLYSKNCILRDGDDYCMISILKKIYI